VLLTCVQTGLHCFRVTLPRNAICYLLFRFKTSPASGGRDSDPQTPDGVSPLDLSGDPRSSDLHPILGPLSAHETQPVALNSTITMSCLLQPITN